MNVFGTQMHVVTFCITMFELAMLFFQVIYFLERTSDIKRLLYLILLLFLILYNVTSGLFPDEKVPMPVILQNILAYLVAFGMSMYVVYYFYRAFELKQLRFFATWGSLLFLLTPFLFLFVLPYLTTGDVAMSRRLTVIIPFVYGLSFIYATSRALYIKFNLASRSRKQADYQNSIELILSAYIALLCWATLPVIIYAGDHQLVEHSVTNAGFMVMSIIYVRSSIKNARNEYNQLITSESGLKMKVEEKDRQIEQLNERQKEMLISLAAKAYKSVLNGSDHGLETTRIESKLSKREKEILNLMVKGLTNKEMADILSISEKTVGKHVSNMLEKYAAGNKVELIYKLRSGTGQLEA